MWEEVFGKKSLICISQNKNKHAKPEMVLAKGAVPIPMGNDNIWNC